MSVSIIAPFFLPVYPVPSLIPSLLAQTDDSWEAVLVHDGQNAKWEEYGQHYADPRIRFRSTRDRLQEYGHPIRAAVLSDEPLNGRYVHMTNGDNYLIPTAVARINEQTADVVAFSILHSYAGHSAFHPRIEIGGIDLCQVAVRTDIARECWNPAWKDHSADFLWVQAIAEKTADWVFLTDGCFVVHN